VEIDGGLHGFDQKRDDDEARTEWLRQNGYRVIRFWNSEVMSNVEGVCAAILNAATGYATPFPPPEIG
jgi:very-short-patch-repair endonuclease